MNTVKLVNYHDKATAYICKHMVINGRKVPQFSNTIKDHVVFITLTCLVCKRHQNKTLKIIEE